MFKVNGDGKILDVYGQGGGGPWKLHNFHGCHMCIVLKSNSIQQNAKSAER